MERKIVEYRIYEPIPEPIKQIFVEVDETGNVYDLNGAPWLPPEGVKLRTVDIVPVDKWDGHRRRERRRALASTEPRR